MRLPADIMKDNKVSVLPGRGVRHEVFPTTTSHEIEPIKRPDGDHEKRKEYVPDAAFVVSIVEVQRGIDAGREPMAPAQFG